MGELTDDQLKWFVSLLTEEEATALFKRIIDELERNKDFFRRTVAGSG